MEALLVLWEWSGTNSGLPIQWYELLVYFKNLVQDCCISIASVTTRENHCWIASFVTKNIIHGNKCIILFLTCYFMSWAHNSSKKRLLIIDFTIVTEDIFFWPIIVTSQQFICDVMQMRGSSTVTSYSSIVACTNWFKGDLQLWITTVNIDFSSPGIHSFACKNSSLVLNYQMVG